MIEFLRFYFVVEILGIVVTPIVLYLFKSLPDKGYSFSKVLSLVFVSYLLWILAVFKLVPNSYFGILFVLLIITFVSVFVFILKKEEIFGLLKSNLKQIAIIELFFFFAFLGATFFRSFVPDIAGTEKPFEFMLFNSILKSEYFPPYDAWYGGEAMSYYYFGYIILSIVSTLAKVSNSFAFNLGISLTWALTAIGIFGIAYNFINLLHVKNKIKTKYQIIFILFIISFFLVLSNFEGILELLAVLGIGDKNFYSFFNVQGLDSLKTSSSWYPTEHWFWWRATRLASNWNVMEFPFFSFLLGDLHPHVLVLPFAVTFLGLSVVLLLQKNILNFSWIKKNLFLFLVLSILLGAIAGINTWFYPAFLIFLTILTFTKNYLHSLHSVIPAEAGIYINDGSPIPPRGLAISWWRKSGMTRIKDTFSFILPIGILSVLSFLPLFATTRTSMNKILPNEVLTKPDFVPTEAVASLPVQLFLFWGPMFLLSLIIIVWYIKIHNVKSKNLKILSGLVAFLPALVWMLAILYYRGINGLIMEIQGRGVTVISIVILTSFLFLSIYAFLKIVLYKKKNIFEGTIFSAICFVIGYLLILGAELFYINDVMGSRYNTVFKFYFVSWMFLSLGIGIGSFEFWILWIRKNIFVNNFAKAILMFYILIIGLSFIYPVISTMNRTNGLRAAISLDGLKYLSYSNPDDYASILWINENVKEKALILEASGADYSMDNIISAMTGLPTLIGWVGTHEVQIHGNYQEAQKRLNAVEEIYKTTDIGVSQKLLKENKVAYVYVGPREANKYGLLGLQKFNKIGEVVFQKGQTKIYKIK